MLNSMNQNKERQRTNAKTPEHSSFDNIGKLEKGKKTFTVLGLNLRSIDYHLNEHRVLLENLMYWHLLKPL